MNRPLLIPLDGSASAEQGLAPASRLARALGAGLHVAHVHAPSALEPLYVEGVPLLDENLHLRLRDHERAYLERIMAALVATHPGLPVEVALLEPAREGGRDVIIAASLAAYAAAIDCAGIVMTTHGRGGFSRFWLGSVATMLLQSTPAPLLLLHPQQPEAGGSELLLRHILLPLDGSPLAETIIDHACRLGQADQARFTLLRIVEPLVLVGPAPFTHAADLAPERTEERQAAAQEYLDQVAGRLRQAGITVETQVVVAERPAAAILEAAERLNADLIALATHGRGGLSRLLAGSVADKVLRGAALPILICRPQQAEGA